MWDFAYPYKLKQLIDLSSERIPSDHARLLRRDPSRAVHAEGCAPEAPLPVLRPTNGSDAERPGGRSRPAPDIWRLWLSPMHSPGR